MNLWKLGTTVKLAVAIRNSSDAPKDADANPTYRVYGETGLLTSGTGSLAKLDTGTVTAASNANPIVITSAAHGLQTGNRVTVASVGGNTAANGDFTVTRIGATTFSLDGSNGNGVYTSGGTWHVTGLYELSLVVSGANGYEAGKNYHVLVNYSISSTAYSELVSFTVT